ncbi:PREDICTED: uncharacterized protein LOC109358040 [Lupinus angustifolius]|uniref:uncharacterized protein LOC109358040 n=1 Tax=Lupinus angustifolius TaxID=3871 RepID=UPI00092E210C|nr:PREDICTED: uncharacterized protein LOC109358040 [Lupinus angustifolius]
MAQLAGNFTTNLPVLDGKNWTKWSIQMRAIFCYQEVSTLVEEGLPILEEVDNAHFEKIAGFATGKEAWDVLEKHYAGAAQLKKIRLQTMEDAAIVEKVLRTVTPKFDHVVVAIEESGRIERMKIEELQGSLEAHEQRLNERMFDYQEQTNREGSHKQSKNWKRKADRKKVRCYNCYKIGHYPFECHAPNKNQHQVKQDPEANLAKGENDDFEDEVVQLMMTTINHKIGIDTWYLDSGCSNHMTGHKNWLVNFDSIRRNKVKFVDNRVVTAEGT